MKFLIFKPRNKYKKSWKASIYNVESREQFFYSFNNGLQKVYKHNSIKKNNYDPNIYTTYLLEYNNNETFENLNSNDNTVLEMILISLCRNQNKIKLKDCKYQEYII